MVNKTRPDNSGIIIQRALSRGNSLYILLPKTFCRAHGIMKNEQIQIIWDASKIEMQIIAKNKINK